MKAIVVILAFWRTDRLAGRAAKMEAFDAASCLARHGAGQQREAQKKE